MRVDHAGHSAPLEQLKVPILLQLGSFSILVSNSWWTVIIRFIFISLKALSVSFVRKYINFSIYFLAACEV